VKNLVHVSEAHEITSINKVEISSRFGQNIFISIHNDPWTNKLKVKKANKALQGTSGHSGFSKFIIVANATANSNLSAAKPACP
jgi:hypothetical protein